MKGHADDTQIELGDSFMRNYLITFDYSGSIVNPSPSSAIGDTTPTNSIGFSVIDTAPKGVAI